MDWRTTCGKEKMKRFSVFLIIPILIFSGCKKLEREKQIVSKPETFIIRDIELERWRGEINKEVYTIDTKELSNPFVNPKIYKALAKKEEAIPLEFVGVLIKGGKKYALLQDSTRKGYIVKVGDKIGRSKIKEISSDYIVIEEVEENIFGELVTKTRKISLKRSESP